MKRVTCLGILLAVALLAPFSAAAQQVTPAELEALARFSQTLQQYYQAGTAISLEMDAAEEAIDRYANGELAEAGMRREVEAIRGAARVAIDDYERGVTDLGTRPKLPDRGREQGMQAFEDMVRGLAGHLEAQWALLERLMTAALSGDETAYNRVSADSLALAGDMIDSENVALEAAMLGAGPQHPQTGLYEAVIGSNLAMQAALIVTEDTLRGREPRVGVARDAIERGLSRATAGIEAGRRNAVALWQGVHGKPAVTEADRISMRFLRELSDAYGAGFDVEAGVVASMRRFVDALVGVLENPGGDDAALLATAETFQTDMMRLADERMNEQSRRLRMVQEFSAALAAAQQ